MSRKQTKSKQSVSVLEEMTLKTLLITICEVSIFSFIISEVVFFYFLGGGISRFPENVVFCIVVLTVGLGLVAKFCPIEVVFSTSSASIATIVCIVNYLLGSSPNPHILPFVQSVYDDLTLLTPASLGWVIVLVGVQKFLKTREISRRYAYSVLFVVGSILLFALILSYSEVIMVFFDEHPWVPSTIIGLLGIMVGIAIGRRRRK